MAEMMAVWFSVSRQGRTLLTPLTLSLGLSSAGWCPVHWETQDLGLGLCQVVVLGIPLLE